MPIGSAPRRSTILHLSLYALALMGLACGEAGQASTGNGAKGISDWGIQVKTGRYFLFRRISPRRESYELAAIKLNPPTHDGTVYYDCHFRDDGKDDLASVPPVRGVLKERLGKTGDPRVFSTEGSALDIVCGSFRAMWSAGNWVYFVDTNSFRKQLRSRADFDITESDATALEQVHPLDPSLAWRKLEHVGS
jgi:hypothetical protein